MSRIFLLILCLIGTLLRPLQAQESSSPRSLAPWAPAPPDACGSIAVPCAQLDDFNLVARIAGLGFWPGRAATPSPWQRGGGLSLGAALSLYKTAELGLQLPVMAVHEPGPARWVYGPPEVRLRWRMGPRMGPGPFGSAWPSAESYPKAIPASYDVRPARWTLALGFRFLPLWPGVRGEGSRDCKATTGGSCMAEAGLQASLDVRAWRLLFTGHGEAVAAGDTSHLRVGGRAALDLAGRGSLFAEGLARLPLAPEAQRGGMMVAGGGLRAFRGVHLQAWYGRSFGGLSGEHLAGLTLDLPIGVVWGVLQRLSEAVDPFVAGDGWIYDDECAPLFRLGRHDGAESVSIGDSYFFNGPSVPVGTHLWRKGDWLYADPAATKPFIQVKPREGSPAPYPINEAAYPWPDADTARRSSEARDQWLRRYARAPDPRRRALCAELMRSFVEELARAALQPTLEERCAQAQRDGAVTLASVGHVVPDDGAVTAMIGSQAAVAVACDETVSPGTIGVLAGALRPGGAGVGLFTTRRRPPAPATAIHAPPTPAPAPSAPAPPMAARPPVPAPRPAAQPAPAPPAVPPEWFAPPPQRPALPPGPPAPPQLTGRPTRLALPPGPKHQQLAPVPSPKALLPPKPVYRPSAENTTRMQKGKAPIGVDGHPVEIHHGDQQSAGPRVPMTRTDHRLGDNFARNHSNTGATKGSVDHGRAWAKEKKDLWRKEAQKPENQKAKKSP